MAVAEREEIEQLRRENEELRRDNEVLRREIERLRRQLEEALRKIKRQAAPFSRNQPKENPQKPGRKPGPQYGEPAGRARPSVINETWVAELPPRCACGGRVVWEETRQQFQEDLVRQKVARCFQVEVGHCARCGRRAQGRHPLQTSDALGAANVQIGPEALVLAAELNKAMGISYAKTAAVLQLGHGLAVERSTLCRALRRVAERARPTYGQLVVAARRTTVAWMDETGWRVAAHLAWLFVLTTPKLTVYAVQHGRGFPQAAALLGADFAGTLHHDGLRWYYRFALAMHQSCVGHLVRRCQAMIEAGGRRGQHGFAARVLDVLHQALAIRGRYDTGEISLHGMRVAAGLFENRNVHRLLMEPVRSAANVRLANHLAHESPYLFNFLRHPAIESTNNRAEREIRPAVVARKTWGGNRTDTGARTFETLSSVLRTAQLQHKNSFSLLLPLLRSRTPFILDLIPDTS